MVELYPPLDVVAAKVAGACDRAGIPYAIIGGLAVNAFGNKRLTEDADFLIELDQAADARIEALTTDLLREGFRFKPETFRSRLERGKSFIHIFTGLVRVDFLFAPRGHSAIAERRRLKLHDKELWFASPEDIIALKLAASRPEDLKDVRWIIGVQRARLDVARVRSLVTATAERVKKSHLVADLERLLAEADALPAD